MSMTWSWRRIGFAVTVASLMLKPLAGHAQETLPVVPPEIMVKSGTGECAGKLPTDNALSLVPNLDVFKSDVGDPTQLVRLKFRQELEFFEDHATGRWLVLTTGQDVKQICGWVDQKFILKGHTAKRVRDIDPNNIRKTKKGKPIQNPLFIKALIRSNPEIEKSSKRSWNPTKVPIFIEPNENSKVIKEISIFGLYYVYKIYEDEKFRKWFYLSGADPYEQVVSGWVRQENVFPWDNQLSLYFSDKPGSSDLIIYPNGELARKQDETQALGRRPKGFKEPEERNIARFPILDKQPLPGNAELYEIAMFGRACQKDGQCSSGKEVTEKLSDIGELARKLRNVDVLFVIDGTESMRNYFPKIYRGVKKAADEIVALRNPGLRRKGKKRLSSKRRKKKGGVRFAVGVYGDYNSPAANPSDMDFKLIDFGFPDDASNLTKLRRIPNFKDYLKDSPEAGFAGILRATREASWREDAATRLVIWIGDVGNRESGDNESITSAVVRDALKSKRVSLFFPINVAGNYKKGWDWHDKFVTQAGEIIEIDKDRKERVVDGVRANRTYDKKSPGKEDTAKRVSNLVKLAMNQAIKGLRRVQQHGQTQTVEASGFKSVERKLKLDIPESELGVDGDLSEAILRANGFSSEAIQRLYGSNQLMTQGYVVGEAGARNLTFWVALNEKKLEIMRKFMTDTCNILKSKSVADRLETLMKNIASGMTGDTFKVERGGTVNDFLTRVMFLPKNQFSTLLDRSPSELEAFWEKHSRDEKGYKLWGQICKSAYLFSLVALKKRHKASDAVKQGTIPNRWTKKKGAPERDFRWQWGLENDLVYYFIPVEFFPGNIETK